MKNKYMRKKYIKTFIYKTICKKIYIQKNIYIENYIYKQIYINIISYNLK